MDLEQTLNSMKKSAIEIGTKSIALPLIGCGLDQLNWDVVRGIIYDTFQDTDITITISKWRK